MTGRDPMDSTSLQHPEAIVLPTAERLDGLRLGVPEALTGEGIEPGVLARFEETLKLAQELGATVERVPLPHAEHGLSAYYVIAPAEASSNLARFDGVRYGLRVDADDLLVDVHARRATTASATRSSGASCSAPTRCPRGYYDAYYGKAQRVRTKIAEDYKNAFETVDFVVTPTAPDRRLRARRQDRRPAGDVPQRLFTVPMSLAGIPAISIPGGLSDDLPVGFQIAGPAFSENRILERGLRAGAGDRLRRDGREGLGA